MENVVKSSKYFFGYFNNLETHSVCQQNGKTLQTLKLRWSEGLELEGIKLITSQCTELTEVSLADTYLSEASINIVSSQLTPKCDNYVPK